MVISIVTNWYALEQFPKKLGVKTVETRNQRKNRYHSNKFIVMIGKNTEKSPGDLRRFDVNGSLEPVHKSLKKRLWKLKIREKIDTIQTNAL